VPVNILSPLVLSPPLALSGGGAGGSLIVVTLSQTVTTTVQAASDGITFRLPLTEPDGDPLDLSNVDTLVAVIRDPAGVKVEHAMAVVSVTGGLADCQTPVGYFTAAGRWLIQARVTYGDGTVYFSKPFRVKAKENL
jgi:hypothetical protein